MLYQDEAYTLISWIVKSFINDIFILEYLKSICLLLLLEGVLYPTSYYKYFHSWRYMHVICFDRYQERFNRMTHMSPGLGYGRVPLMTCIHSRTSCTQLQTNGSTALKLGFLFNEMGNIVICLRKIDMFKGIILAPKFWKGVIFYSMDDPSTLPDKEYNKEDVLHNQ